MGIFVVGHVRVLIYTRLYSFMLPCRFHGCRMVPGYILQLGTRGVEGRTQQGCF